MTPAYYFSGSMGRRGPECEVIADKITHRLCSCHASYIREAEYWSDLIAHSSNAESKELLFDSGAFTSWSKGHMVDLKELIETYRKLVNKYGSSVKNVWLINLDVIPGSPGRTALKDEIDEAIKQSDINFRELTREFGSIVLPVFHQNEDEARLKEVADMADYICVSPRNDVVEKYRVEWAQYVHSLIPGKKTHGLATTGEQMMLRVPWYSVDSATWLYIGAMGNVAYLCGSKLNTIAISNESPARYDMYCHYETSSNLVKEAVRERASEHGITVDELKRDHMARKLMNGLEIVEWLELLKKPKQNFSQINLFEL